MVAVDNEPFYLIEHTGFKHLMALVEPCYTLPSSTYHSVPHIRPPPFATLAPVENVGGAYMRDLTFYLVNTPPLPFPRLDVDILQTDTEAGSTRSYTGLSHPPETRIHVPFGQDRLREVGHSVDGGVFQAFCGFVLSMCCC